MSRYCADVYECSANNNIAPSAKRHIKLTVECKYGPVIVMQNNNDGARTDLSIGGTEGVREYVAVWASLPPVLGNSNTSLQYAVQSVNLMHGSKERYFVTDGTKNDNRRAQTRPASFPFSQYFSSTGACCRTEGPGPLEHPVIRALVQPTR